MSPSFLITGSSWGSLLGVKLTSIGFFRSKCLALSPCTFTKCVDDTLTLQLQLHRRLVNSHSIRADGGSASRCHSCPHESALVKTERKEKCAFSGLENHLSRRCVGFAHDSGSYNTCSDRVDLHHGCKGEKSQVTHCEAVWETAGSDGSCVQRDTYWPAVHQTPTVVAQDQWIFP